MVTSGRSTPWRSGCQGPISAWAASGRKTRAIRRRASSSKRRSVRAEARASHSSSCIRGRGRSSIAAPPACGPRGTSAITEGCGATQAEIKMGDVVIALGSVRSEGTPDGYVPKEYPAVASLDVVNALIEAAQASGARYHVGLIRSVDALYSDLLPDQMPRPHLRGELAMWSKAGVLSNDIETSTLFVVARLRKLRAGTSNLCVDELGAGEIHHLDPSYMDRMLKVAVDAVRRLIGPNTLRTQRQ